jgi:ribosomal protein S18 acetylase RimI-like enzyme
MNAGTSSAITLRDGGCGDAEAIEAVHYASREAVYRGRVADWPPAGPDRKGRVERWREWLSDPDIVSVVGEVNGEVVGFCTVRSSGDQDADPTIVAEMPTLYVHPDAWHRGYGRSLCSEGLKRAVERGFHELTLWVLEMNIQARDFYSAFGFTLDAATKVDEGSIEGLIARRYRIEF